MSEAVSAWLLRHLLTVTGSQADTITAAVERLLADPPFGAAAASVAGEIERMPAPDDVAGVPAALVHSAKLM